MVFFMSDYNNSAFAHSNGQYQFTHKTYGANMFRHFSNFGRLWFNWTNWKTIILLTVFTNGSDFCAR